MIIWRHKCCDSDISLGFSLPLYIHKQRAPSHARLGALRVGGDLLSHRIGSTIGAGGLNFSVRHGKRWSPTAVATVRPSGSSEPYGVGVVVCEARRRTPGAARQACRAISTARLWRHRLYTCSLSTWSSPTALKGGLILGGASRLDAFSAYPFNT